MSTRFSFGIFTFVFFLCISVIKVSADSIIPPAGVQSANRRTALRCLSLSKEFVDSQDWNAALSQVTLGLSYDDSVSDLWYLMAVSHSGLGAQRSVIIPLLENSLKKNNWVDYNRDAARLMYADVLSDTGESKKAVEILDAEPFVYSADAEYVRIKALYRIGDEQSVSLARTKMEGAGRIYPSDTRFPLLFFKSEYGRPQSAASSAIASYFISRVSQYAEAAPDKDAELEIYAASFAAGEMRVRMLKSFSARDLRHPLYAIVALDANLLSEQDALSYICDFSDDSIDFDLLSEFLQKLGSDDVKKEAAAYFNSYSGVIEQDTDRDGLVNLYVKYGRGRPQTVFYDKNQDGISDWSLACDFGAPVSGSMKVPRMDFTWDDFPYLSSVSLPSGENDIPSYEFGLVSRELEWSPVLMNASNSISHSLGFDFYYPVLNEDLRSLSKEELLACASSLSVNTNENGGKRIKFLIQNGQTVSAEYYNGQKMYAVARFDRNTVTMRVVDSDSDGIFETTEIYAADHGGTQNAFSDEQRIMQNLFGTSAAGSGVYLRMIQVDTNADSIIDFTEEYLEDGTVVSSWDTDGDANWDVRNFRNDKDATETAEFRNFDGKNSIFVTLQNKIPASVKINEKEFSVTKDISENFYWIGEKNPAFAGDFYSECAQKALEHLAAISGAAASAVLEFKEDNGSIRINCVRMGSFNYGMIIPYLETLPSLEKETAE